MIELPPELPWRTGSKHYRRHPNHRTLYVQQGDHPDEMDLMIGVMDTPELAEMVVQTRAVLADMVRLHDGPRDAVYESGSAQTWREARRVLAAWIRLPSDT